MFELFERLDRIPWAQLRQAHGYAGHVPAAVRGLLSPDAAVVHRSYWVLDNYVVLQSDLYEAAAYLPDLLADALDLATPTGQDRILELLFEIGNGYAPPDVKLRYVVSGDGGFVPVAGTSAPSLCGGCNDGALAALEDYLSAGRGDGPLRRRVESVVADLREARAYRRELNATRKTDRGR